MGETFLERANREAVDKLNSRDTLSLITTAKRMNGRKFYPSELIDAICQKWEGRARFDIYDAYGFLKVVDFLACGDVLFRQLPLEGEPFADRMIEQNNTVLRTLPEGVQAVFAPGSQCDDDGQVTISVPIRFRRMVGEKEEIVLLNKEAETWPNLWPLSFPLEVGTCPSCRSWFHLIRNGALARWPYGHKMLHLFCVAPGRWDRVRPKLF